MMLRCSVLAKRQPAPGRRRHDDAASFVSSSSSSSSYNKNPSRSPVNLNVCAPDSSAISPRSFRTIPSNIYIIILFIMAPPGQPETFLNPSTIEKTFSLNFRGFLLKFQKVAKILSKWHLPMVLGVLRRGGLSLGKRTRALWRRGSRR